MNEKLLKLSKAIAEKKNAELAKQKTETEKLDTIKNKWASKAKVKALTDKERIDRIEEILGLK